MNYLGINIDNQPVELPERDNLGLSVSYILEDADQFQQKSGSPAFNINIPATPANDQIFNTYHNANVEDMSGTDAYTNPRKCEIIVGGVTILKGKSLLQDASHTRIAAGYNINAYGQNGDWVIDMKDLSLWDCLNTATHTFDVFTVEESWGAFNIDEYHDFVYAPVRYRQPFGYTTPNGVKLGDDDAVNIYHLRPSISIYWLLIRGWRQFGYTVRSQFLESSYFQGMVIPWVWGSFFDINNQLEEAASFKAVGELPTEKPALTGYPTVQVWTGVNSGTTSGSAGGSSWWGVAVSGGLSGGGGGVILPVGGEYVFDGNMGADNHFRISNTNPPYGKDNFSQFSFNRATGTASYLINLPSEILSFYGSNFTANFTLSTLLTITGTLGVNACLALEITHIFASGAPTVVTNASVLPSGGNIVGATHYPDGSGYPTSPTVYLFSVPNLNNGDTLQFRLRALTDGGGFGATFSVSQAGYLNQSFGNNASVSAWVPIFTTLELTGLEVTLGGTVNFKNYDKFRDYRFMDMLGGLIDMFNLSVQTDPINKVITIEATHEWKLPTGGAMPGYFRPERIDWTDKQDLVQPNTMNLYSDCERQFDFSFKQDGSDGGQNIYAARYRGIYLANRIANSFNRLNNTNNENGIKAGVPGASRYVFPERFRKGSRQLTNRFFSATMHYKHKAWKDITGVAPQLIAIIPENINDASASAVSAIFEPKIAFYKGYVDNALYGGWRYIGDPNAHGTGIPTYTDATGALGFDLPFMFSVNYGHQGGLDPVLTYCRQLLDTGAGIAPVAGLMETFFFKRLAMMRHGRQYRPWVRLNSGDMTDWEHRNTIILNGALYYLIGVDRWNPLSDNPAQCTLWKVAHIEQVEFDNSYPSDASVNGATVLSQFDLRYAPLLLYPTDIPQVQ